MKESQISDNFHIRSAVGWLELGNPAEAEAELQHVSADTREHPDFLRAQWLAAKAQKHWLQLVSISDTLLAAYPECSIVWRIRAETVREVIGTAEAARFLTPVAELFPNDTGVRYNLACFFCELGRLEEARHWLIDAFRVIRSDPYKSSDERVSELQEMYRKALDASELKPLWTG